MLNLSTVCCVGSVEIQMEILKKYFHDIVRVKTRRACFSLQDYKEH